MINLDRFCQEKNIMQRSVIWKMVTIVMVKWKSLNCVRLFATRNSPGQNTAGGNCSLLLRIFPTQGSNPGLPHRRWILYQLSHKGSLRILEWVAYPSSSRSSWPRNPTQLYSLSTELSGKPIVMVMVRYRMLFAFFPLSCLASKGHQAIFLWLFHEDC